jgi:hypothetical protein
MKISALLVLIVSICLFTLSGCGAESAPRVTIQEGGSAKKRVIKMNEQHQERLEQLTLPGQN